MPTRCAACARPAPIIFGKTVTTEFAYFNPGPTRNPHDLDAHAGRLVVRLGRRGRGRHGAAGARHPDQRLGDPPGFVLRRRRRQAEPRDHLARRRADCCRKKLDHVGVFARGIDDAALLLDVLAGHDPADTDTRTAAAATSPRTAAEEPPLPPKLAFLRTPKWDQRRRRRLQTAFEELAAKLGEHVEEIELPEHFGTAWDDHRVIMASDMAHRFGPWTDKGGDKSSEQLRKLIEQGRGFSSVRYLDALGNVQRMRASLAGLFERYYAILTPAAPGPAPKGMPTGDPVFNSLWTMTGVPAVTLPLLSGEDDLPVGVQLIGAFGDDAPLAAHRALALRDGGAEEA